MHKKLKRYFPMIRTRTEILAEIRKRKDLNDLFQSWTEEQQEEFLDFCTGIKGLKVLYDGVFKEVFSPETAPERLEALLSLLLKRKVKIRTVLPNDSIRLGAESSLLYTDIIVELEDGNLANVEIQKIGYAFPGQRSACYSAEHLLRQYKRVRGKKKRHFRYQDIKNVYTIVFFEQSGKEFQAFPEIYLHVFRQQSDTGLELPLLQEYFFISLDIYRKNMDNKAIKTELESWLAFLSFDEPERIEELITRFPEFQAMYQDIYELCLNTERVMEVYSKELAILDRNTVHYMMDEMQEEINQKKEELRQQNEKLQRQDKKIQQQDEKIQQQDEKIQQQAAVNQQLAEENRQLKEELSRIKKEG